MKKYKNISTLEQLGIEPGETGEREMHKDQEDRMVARGAIEVVTTSGSSSASTSPSAPESGKPGVKE